MSPSHDVIGKFGATHVARGLLRQEPAPRVLTGFTVTYTAAQPGQVALYSEGRTGISLLADMGDSYPRVTQGYGGFDSVPRPRQQAILRWNGFDLLGYDVDVSLDNLEAGTSVERACAIVEAMAGRGPLGSGGQPPELVLDTAGVVSGDCVAFPDARWVVDNLDWHEDDGETTITNHAGNRVRALVTVSLLQASTTPRLRTAADALARVTGAEAGTKSVKAEAHDSLQKIARRYLGDAGKWTVLAKLNPGIRDPRSIKAGTQVKVPR